jgi:hypothetical protein
MNLYNVEKNMRSKLQKNKTLFEKMLKKISSSSYSLWKILLSKKAIFFALKNGTSYYSSELIETTFLELGQQYSCKAELSTHPEPNSVLHIMTHCLSTGGHTRVVERWIEQAEPHEKHFLVFTTAKKSNSLPERLSLGVSQKNGRIFFLNYLSDLKKGLELRKIASNYEKIILHIHMYDVVPLVAFGNEEFLRPIILYNHADHLFWVGISIADAIAETRSWGKEISEKNRGSVCSEIVGIPVDTKIKRSEKKRDILRKKLNLPTNQKIILSAASTIKYRPFGDLNFIDYAEKILNKEPNAIIIVIGASPLSLPGWQSFQKKMEGRFLTLETQPTESLYEYAEAADLALDSFPLSGGTTLLDLICAGCPVLSLESPIGHLDYTMNSISYCENESVLFQKIGLILHDPSYREKNIREMRERAFEHQGPEKWKKNLARLYNRAGSKHSIRSFSSKASVEPTLIDLYLGSTSISWFLIFRIPLLAHLAIYLYEHRNASKS